MRGPLASPTMGRFKTGEFCSAINCQNCRGRCPGLSFFRYPKDPERCMRWIVNTRREDLLKKKPEVVRKSAVVLCAEHFEDDQFMNPTTRNKLMPSAVPTKFNVPNPPPSQSVLRPIRNREVLPSKSDARPKEDPPSEPKPSTSAATSGAISVVPESHLILGSLGNGLGDQTLETQPIENMDTDDPCQESVTASTPKMNKDCGIWSHGIQMTPRKEKLKRCIKRHRVQIHRLRKKILTTPKSESTEKPKKTDMKKLFDDLSQYLSGSSLQFVMTQIKMSQRREKGRRWSAKDKSLALSILHSSPRAYRLLQKIFRLPAVKTLRKSVRNVQVQPGFPPPLMEAFSLKVKSMSEHSKICAVVFDEMVIKESVCYNATLDEIEGLEDFGLLGKSRYVANHATVFMARGLTSKWKQPVGYFLSSSTIKPDKLKTLLLCCIDKLEETGLDVKAVICDQGSNNTSAVKSLGVSIQNPGFVHNDKRVLVFYDPPHLLKNVRNNLRNKKQLLVGGDSVLWEDIVNFYQADCLKLIRMAPKLTQKHIDLPMFSTMRVKLAAQILSHSVAAGISAMVELGSLPEQALSTAHFVEEMDQLFNSFNSSHFSGNRKMQYAISSKSTHIEHLRKKLIWLRSIKTPAGKVLPCVEGWQLSINSLIELWEDIHNSHNVSFLFTNRLNQDCIENLFSVIRGKGLHRDNPDACQFRCALRQVMVDQVLLTSSSSNCVEDVDSFLFSLSSFSTNTVTDDHEIHPGDVTQLPESVKSMMKLFIPPDVFSLEENNILTYIAGYIARKISMKICISCQKSLKCTLDESDPTHVFLKHKQYAEVKKGGLVAPSSELVEVCTLIEKSFRDTIDDILYIVASGQD